MLGYNDVLLIPVGATNIKIREVKASNNYLAIRNVTGHYYLNGNWRIDFPREMKFAGSTFHYERKPHAFIAPETITALGPTSEALYVVLLYQEPNPGIEYEYSFPKDVQLPTGGDSYNWIYGSWSDCTASCGGGKSNLIFSFLTGKRLNANVDQGSKREMSVAPRRAISKWFPTNCATLN